MAATARLRPARARGVLWVVSVLLVCGAAAYKPEDNYLVSCGSSLDTPVGRRLFLADDGASGAVTLTSPRSAAVKAPPDLVSGFRDAALYQNARVFSAPSSYSFAIRHRGRHFLRLHFFPFVYRSYDLAAAARAFKVSTQDAVLLEDGIPAPEPGNASTSTSPQPARLEFLLDVARDTLVVSFVPLADGGIAFVNAVELVSVPDGLVADAADSSTGRPEPIPAVLPLQTAYRLNVGGPAVAPDDDALWREWTTDLRFLSHSVADAVTREVRYNGMLNRLPGQATATDAPDIVYATARELVINGSSFDGQKQMAWQFDVDTSSSYFIRFHFCDIVGKAPHQLHINAYVDDATVKQDLDLAAVGDGALAFPYYTDFVLPASEASGKLAVHVGPLANKIVMPAAILNGIEIMKMHLSAGSVVVVQPAAGAAKSRFAVVLGSVCGALAFISVAVALAIVLRKKEKEKEVEEGAKEQPTPTQSQSSTPWMPLLGRFSVRGAIASGSSSFTTAGNTPGASPRAAAAAAVMPSYRFPLAMLQDATRNFDDSLIIGEGGFGKVYGAVLQDGTKVAVKRASPESQQGAREFRTEIELLSGLRHRHLVSLVGYCDEREEMILLYEYMEHGSLRSRLYGRGGAAPLSWAQRLEACAGAARGLLYLHTAVDKPVIHRDVKSSNILLDGDLAGKVADFGLSKAGPVLDETHVSTAVKGSFGYVDPEYCRTRQLTAKSDVYSLGVVLLEAVCARPVVDPRLPKPMSNLVEWGLHWQGRGELEKIVDRRIAAAARPAALRKYGETVARCLAERGADRPAMEDVVWNLQFVMRLQEGDGLDFSDVSSLNMVTELTPPRRQRSAVDHDGLDYSDVNSLNMVTELTPPQTGSVEGDGEADDDFTDASMRGTFWQMVNVRSR
ncbi:probable receptor-like protein kinase At5g59700 [Aegilops tauschii subsp. strangulata]|uniref:Protein kinase domain-containing protein n=1 Tax=Aegilops tauschii subsp. strangulata TaxID=200361 RepID=A0A453EC41_AEGTS|nr:receptor-like protein kinase HERK 1 [Aegilops tauschii subsp. strangulata]